MNNKFASTIAGASIFITLTGLVGRGFGFIREIIFANYFGLNPEIDLYLVSTVFPVTINSIILYLAQNYVIPNYNRIKKISGEDSKKFITSTFWLFVLCASAITLFLFIFSEPFLKFYLQDSADNYLTSTVLIFRIFILTIPLNAAVSVLSAYSQAEFEFKFPALSQLFLNISVILLVIISTDSFGIYSIPAGYVLGTVLQLVYLLFKSRGRFNYYITGLLKDKSIFILINSSFIFIIIIETISQLYLLADRVLYGYVDSGGIAALNYALNVYILPVSIISVAISTAVFPTFSRNISTNSIDVLSGHLNNFFRVNLFLFVPVSFIFFFYSEVIIELLFQRGEFGNQDTIMTANILKLYSLSIIFYSSYVVLNKLLYSANLVKHLLIITITGLTIKVFLNFFFVDFLKQDGLALSTSISFFFFFAASFVVILIKIPFENKNFFYKEFIFLFFNGFICYLVVSIAAKMIFIQHPLLNGVIEIVLFCLVYIFNSYVVKDKSFEMLTHSAKRIANGINQ